MSLPQLICPSLFYNNSPCPRKSTFPRDWESVVQTYPAPTPTPWTRLRSNLVTPSLPRKKFVSRGTTTTDTPRTDPSFPPSVSGSIRSVKVEWRFTYAVVNDSAEEEPRRCGTNHLFPQSKNSFFFFLLSSSCAVYRQLAPLKPWELKGDFTELDTQGPETCVTREITLS